MAKPEVIQWNKNGDRGIMLRLSRADAISLAASILSQIDNNTANSERLEFNDALLVQGKKKYNIYLSVAVQPEPDGKVGKFAARE